jgi:hypothetical protein
LALPTLGAVTIERIRGGRARTELIDFLAAREPETTWALAVTMRPESERQRKVWVVRREGSIAGVLVSMRYCFDRWTGILLLPDLRCADEMASALDRSNLWTVAGPADSIEAVLPLTRRGRGVSRMWLHSIPYVGKSNNAAADTAVAGDTTAEVTAAEVIVREAAANDVRSLVALYYSLDNRLRVPRRRLRGTVRRALRYTLVAESGQGVVGAIMSSAASKYTLSNRLVVSPTVGRGRVAFLMSVRAGVVAMAEGKGVCGFRPGPDGSRALARGIMGVSADEVRAPTRVTAWASAALRPPKRFRGQNTLRRLVERLEGGVA